MLDIGNLPVIVIARIIKIIHLEDGHLNDMKFKLPLIAINSIWRQTGLTVLYDSLVFGSNLNNTHSNIDLYTAAAYRALVKRVVLCPDEENFKYGGLSNSLIQYMVKLSGYSIDLSKTHLMAKDNMDFIPIGLEVFAGLFPNVIHIDCNVFYYSASVHCVLTNLFKNYSRQLTFLKYGYPRMPKDCPQFPPQLTCLDCDFSCMSVDQIPRLNPYPLKSLRITEPPADLLLLFTEGADNNQVTFPNLKSLWLTYEHDYNYYMFSRRGQLNFPKLQTLGVVLKDSPGLHFTPVTLPDHLSKLVLIGDSFTVGRIGMTLPVKSVGHIQIQADAIPESVAWPFFRGTSRLLDGTEITHYTAEVKLLSFQNIDMDIDRIHWKNVAKLELTNPGFVHCIRWLQQVPSVRHLNVTFVKKRFSVELNEENPIPPFQLNGSMVECLTINRTSRSFGMGYYEKLLLSLMRSLKHLKWVYLPKDKVFVLSLEIQQEKDKYPHLCNIEIRPIQ